MRKYKAYKYRIYPNTEQEELIQKTFVCVQYVYNYFLAERIQAWNEKKEKRDYYSQSRMLTFLKNEEKWLKEPDKNALQLAIKNLDAAYKGFYRRVKNGEVPGFPKFKEDKGHRKSYQTSTGGKWMLVRIEGQNIRLPKLGLVKAVIHRDLPDGARILNATVSQEPSGKYFVSVGFEYNLDTSEVSIDVNNSVGLDYSSPHFYVDNEGNKADMPHFQRNAERKIRREQRKLARKQEGSKNWEKQRMKVARANEKAKLRRDDWQHKESKRLADEFDIVAVEGTDYQSLSHHYNIMKATNDNAFSQFRCFLDYKLEERGKKLYILDRFYPSSKTCHNCGYVNNELTVNDRQWTCPQCGMRHDRDINAAINIRNQGMILYKEENIVLKK